MSSKSFVITLKDSVKDIDIAEFKEFLKEINGQITDEFSLIKGFAVELPETLHLTNIMGKFEHIIENIKEDREIQA